jgi:hypothetical protein
MKAKWTRLTALAVAAIVAAGSALGAQSAEKYTARLGWVPIAGAERATVTGKGSATATLAGPKLTITGSFEGLASPATVARLHRGVAKGARGPAIADLVVTKAATGNGGTITGAVDLTAEQLESLKQGRLYIQLHSEKGVAPDGSNLWGWFLR